MFIVQNLKFELLTKLRPLQTLINFSTKQPHRLTKIWLFSIPTLILILKTVLKSLINLFESIFESIFLRGGDNTLYILLLARNDYTPKQQ